MTTSEYCLGTPNGDHTHQYGKIGLSPCREFVAHQSDMVCDVINNPITPEIPLTLDDCMCRAEACPCGKFISHRASDICPVKI